MLVTGGSRGIGLATAQRFAAQGDRVAVTYNSTPPPDGLFAVKCDVTSGTDVDAAFDAVEAEFGGTVQGPRVQRRDHQRRSAPADERGRLHLGDRRQPHRRLPGHQACRPVAC